ncbi:unnamed protein product [Arctia plantaginis]|uniref:NADH dehydrogenase [ubiquinone] 1 alpha subcomplex subunit 12 n=1 Tax=Arctia plantaginis TaxID=874455 RepID=A0A8S0Z167_ARCPL|nr:unnamed protein product [Arctia plantaginis]
MLSKWARAIKLIRANGGIIRSILKIWRTDTLKDGHHVGTDSWGNKYYENYYYMIGRSRFVEFNPRFKFEYDASQITAEWHGWLHYKTDNLPCEDPAKSILHCCPWTQSWLLPHEENYTGTDLAFYPYSTVAEFINTWDGCTVSDRIAKCTES